MKGVAEERTSGRWCLGLREGRRGRSQLLLVRFRGVSGEFQGKGGNGGFKRHGCKGRWCPGLGHNRNRGKFRLK